MTILDTILKEKRTEVAVRKVNSPLSSLEKEKFFDRKCLSLEQFILDNKRTGIIAEFKRRSPSKGVINENAEVSHVTAGYTQYGASGLSILTDNLFFGGSMEDMVAARENNLPVLQKDFIIDEYQILEAKAYGADAILLIAAYLTIQQVKKLATFAKSLGLEVLLELHEESELEHICDQTQLIGVNNRNLKDFIVDLEHSFRLADKIPSGKVKIAESGINSHHTIKLFREKGFKGFLIGEHFMKERDPVQAFKKFVAGSKEK